MEAWRWRRSHGRRRGLRRGRQERRTDEQTVEEETKEAISADRGRVEANCREARSGRNARRHRHGPQTTRAFEVDEKLRLTFFFKINHAFFGKLKT